MTLKSLEQKVDEYSFTTTRMKSEFCPRDFSEAWSLMLPKEDDWKLLLDKKSVILQKQLEYALSISMSL